MPTRRFWKAAEAAATASDSGLSRASDHEVFQFVYWLSMVLPLQSRGPGFGGFVGGLGISPDEAESVSGLLARIDRAIGRQHPKPWFRWNPDQ